MADAALSMQCPARLCHTGTVEALSMLLHLPVHPPSVGNTILCYLLWRILSSELLNPPGPPPQRNGSVRFLSDCSFMVVHA